MQTPVCKTCNTIGVCDYNGLINMNTGVPIDNNSSFPTNPALISATLICVRHWTDESIFEMYPPTWYWTNAERDGMRCYWVSWTIASEELCVISTATRTSQLFWSPKLYPVLNALLVLYLKKTMLVHILLKIIKPSFEQKRYIFFFVLPIHRICHHLNMSGNLFVSISLGIPSSRWYKETLGLDRSNLELSSSFTDSKNVRFDTTL